MARLWSGLVCGGLLIMSLPGCSGGVGKGPTGVVLAGRIVNQGQPLEVKRPEIGLGMVEVILFSEATNGGVKEMAMTKPDGRFEFRGPGNGVPAARYKLAVRQWKEGYGTVDGLGGKFAIESTPIIVDLSTVKAGNRHDLGDVELTSYSGQSAAPASN